MDFEAGTLVGDYEILGQLGAGGMGEVYHVRHSISHREEAMKVLLRDLKRAPELAERFVREIQVHARLNHPHIASLHNALRVENHLVMVMELVEGVSLSARLRRPGVSLAEGIGYTRQVLSALGYAHAAGVTHRDIKPSNIMITPQGQVKLLDFGLATISGDHRLTRTGAIVGSVPYMSPEQIRSETPDARSDLYSLGVTLWEVAAGQCPFQGEGEFAILMGHLQADPEPPRASRPDVPEKLWSILLKALAKDPAQRYQTAEDFDRALSGMESVSASEAAHLPRTLTVAMPPAKEKTKTNPEILDKVAKDLATFVGPIAKVLVKRTASSSKSLDEICNDLAKEISSAKDRERFLAAAKRHQASQF